MAPKPGKGVSVKDQPVQKGLHSTRLTQWADQFGGSAGLYLEALKLVRDKAVLEKVEQKN